MEKKAGQRADITRKVDQFRKAQSSSETEESESTQAAQPAETVEAQSSVSGTDLDVINQIGSSIDTSKLAEIDRLVDAGLVDKSAGAGSKLDAILGGPAVKPDANSLVSSGATFDVFHQAYIPGGVSMHVYPDGSILTGNAPGVGMVRTPDGMVQHVTVQPGGTTIQQTTEGVAIRTPDGVVTSYGADGVTTIMPGGLTTNVGIDGSSTTTLPDGTVVKSDGTVTSPSSGSSGSSQGDSGSQGGSSGSSGQSASGGGNSGSDDGGSDDDDDDDDDNSSADTEAATETESGDSDGDSDSGSGGDEGTPNPMNEETGGPPIWLVTDGRLGGEEQANAERAIDMATGAGHTTPVDEKAGSNLEFLASPVGQQQLKQDVAAVEQAKGGGVTDPAPDSDTPSGIPTREDLERIEFIAAGGGLVNPPSVAEIDDEDDDNAAGVGLADIATAATQQQSAADLFSSSADLTSIVSENLQANLDKSSIDVNIDVDKIEDVSG